MYEIRKSLRYWLLGLESGFQDHTSHQTKSWFNFQENRTIIQIKVIIYWLWEIIIGKGVGWNF